LVGMLLNIITKGEDDDGTSFDTVDTEKAAEIDMLIRDTKSDRAAFLKYMGVTDVRGILAKDHAKAIAALKKKAKSNAA
jgi:hypothetical protein